jgi:hypothetical protein
VVLGESFLAVVVLGDLFLAVVVLGVVVLGDDFVDLVLLFGSSIATLFEGKILLIILTIAFVLTFF